VTGVKDKAIFRSVTVYNKISSQCSIFWTARRLMIYGKLFINTAYHWFNVQFCLSPYSISISQFQTCSQYLVV